MNLSNIAAIVCTLFIPFLSAEAMSADPLPIANFTAPKSSTSEVNGTIELRVIFSRDFDDPLTFSVDGTAERGADFELQRTVVRSDSNAREARIVINLVDDAVVEDVETIRVTLRPGEGVDLGPHAQHTVYIQDNDVNWLVVHDVDGMRFDYFVEVIRDGGTVAARATSDGGNGLPAGTWPVEIDTLNTERFEAVVGPIPIEAGHSLLGAGLARSFRLLVESSEEGGTIDYDRPLIGSVIESWAATEDAHHLTWGDPILGTVLVSRAGATPITEDSAETPAVAPLERWSERECGAFDKFGQSDFTVRPISQISKPATVGQPFAILNSPEQLITAEIFRGSESQYPVRPTFAQPFSAPIYVDLIDQSLGRASSALYYDKARTPEERNQAAFRYKALLYEEVDDAEMYIRARFDKMEEMWDCASRERAYRTARELATLLPYAPTNRALRWALLDIYYDMAVADKALAQEKSAAVAEMMIKGPLAPGQRLIDDEISGLEQVISLYRRAFAVYTSVLQSNFSVDVSSFDPVSPGEPFAFRMFREEVPTRSPYAALLKNADGGWELPNPATHADQPRLFKGYKDVTLLFELLREYLRAAEQLSKRYVLRRQPRDVERADTLISDALRATWLEGHGLLAMFPEIHNIDGPVDQASGLREAVAGWRHTYTALGHIRRYLAGDTNLLGFDEDFLVRTQSTIRGDEEAEYFHSFDYLAKYLTGGGPLQRARDDLKAAQVYYDNYRDRSDQLAQQFVDRAEQYDLRLREIVGVSPGEAGYNEPQSNDGGLIGQQLLSIELARSNVEAATLAMQNLEEEVRIEIWRRGQAVEINDAISQLYLDFVGADREDLEGTLEEPGVRNQLQLTEQLAEISADQTYWNNWASAAASVSGSAGINLGIFQFGGSVSGGAVAYPVNASYQRDQELQRGALTAAKERLDALQRARVQSLQGDLLDVDSQARVKTILLRMGQLQLESAQSVLALRQQMAILEALYLEKKDLERRKAESNEVLADRYFADPSHRLVKDAYLLRTESSFASAQRWMFLLVRTAEYKWNQPFKFSSDSGVTFTMQSLYTARNALELADVFHALDEWDARMDIGSVNDDDAKVFSVREDFFGYVQGGQYFDQTTGESLNAVEAFQRFLLRADNYLDPGEADNPFDDATVLKLQFSTAYTPTTGGLFLRTRWLEKIRHLRVLAVGASPVGLESKVDGFLKHGGLSLIRNQTPGTRHETEPDRLVDEFSFYPTGHWYYRDNQWLKQEAFGTSITVQTSIDPKVELSAYEIDTFRELSVAATQWTLYIVVERDGRKLINVGELQDIQFRLHFYWYARPLSGR